MYRVFQKEVYTFVYTIPAYIKNVHDLIPDVKNDGYTVMYRYLIYTFLENKQKTINIT